MHDTMRPDDQDVVSAELRALGGSTPFPVLFGGLVDGTQLVLSAFVGTRSQVLRGLVIESRRGAGGRAIHERRPVAVRGYSRARSITHEYDREVGAEGIKTLLAVPVVVDGRTRATLYAGLREDAELGNQAVAPVLQAAAAVTHEFAVRDEVDRRVRLLGAATQHGVDPRDPAVAETITESYLRLAEIARRSDDPALRAEVGEVSARLRRVVSPADARTGHDGHAPRVALSGREFEVLSYVALGCRNAEVAERLSVRPETVKSYLRNVMAKLEVHNRQAAVVEARRRGLLA